MSDDPIGGVCSIAALACVELCVGFYTSIISTRRTHMPCVPDCCLYCNCCGLCSEPDLPDRVEGERDAESDADTYVGSDGNTAKKKLYVDPERAPLLTHGEATQRQPAGTISTQPIAQPPINADPTNVRNLSSTT